MAPTLLPSFRAWCVTNAHAPVFFWSNSTGLLPRLYQQVPESQLLTWRQGHEVFNLESTQLIWVDGRWLAQKTEAFVERQINRFIESEINMLITDVPYGVSLPNEHWNTPQVAIRLTDKPSPAVALTQPLGTRATRLVGKQLQLAQITYLRAARQYKYSDMNVGELELKNLLQREPIPADGFRDALQQADSFQWLVSDFWVGSK